MQQLTSATSAGVNISFAGLINVTVSVHSAVGEDDSRSLRTVCTGHGEDAHSATPVKQHLICPVCDNPGTTPFAKGKMIGDGLVVIPQDVIDAESKANAAYKKSITLTSHPVHEVTSVMMPSGKSYYLSLKNPGKGALDAYTLLGKLVSSRPDLAFMCKFTLRSSTNLFQLVVAGDGTLVLRQMADAELVREHPVIEFSEISGRMLELAGLLADETTTSFLVAEHGTGKANIIAEYAAKQTPVTPVATGGVATESANVLDLTAALEAALANKPAPAKKAATPRKRAPRTAAKAS